MKELDELLASMERAHFLLSNGCPFYCFHEEDKPDDCPKKLEGYNATPNITCLSCWIGWLEKTKERFELMEELKGIIW